jgi:cyclic beta-1,2-glucan synthetase
LRGDQLHLAPCIPKAWPGFTIAYQHRGQHHVTPYAIQVENPRGVCAGVAQIELDGQPLEPDSDVALADDGTAHTMRVTLG